MKIDVKYHKIKYCECEQQQVYKRIIQEQKDKIKELTCTLHLLKKAVAKAEVCGVPLHHLSNELAKHFDTETYSFAVDIEAKAIENFANCLRDLTMIYIPDGVSDDMLNGWKSGIMDARKAAADLSTQLMEKARIENV